MTPWAIYPLPSGLKPDDTFLIPLWEQYKPKDFYFALRRQEDVGITIAYIVPMNYFDCHCKMFHDSMPIVQYLPDYLIETMAGMYETRNQISTVKKDLLTKGFKYDHYFQQHIDKEYRTFEL